jgi:hypothetical protein
VTVFKFWHNLKNYLLPFVSVILALSKDIFFSFGQQIITAFTKKIKAFSECVLFSIMKLTYICSKLFQFLQLSKTDAVIAEVAAILRNPPYKTHGQARGLSLRVLSTLYFMVKE